MKDLVMALILKDYDEILYLRLIFTKFFSFGLYLCENRNKP